MAHVKLNALVRKTSRDLRYFRITVIAAILYKNPSRTRKKCSNTQNKNFTFFPSKSNDKINGSDCQINDHYKLFLI